MIANPHYACIMQVAGNRFTCNYVVTMLRPGFLRALSDWVSECYALHPGEMEKAAKEFGLMRLCEHAPEPDKVLSVFSEWLVFDRKSRIFGSEKCHGRNR